LLKFLLGKGFMMNQRKYGDPPYQIVVIHGGPGAGGEMEPVARVLSQSFGVLEPLQTLTTMDGQVNELCTVLENHANPPVILIGFSWGAWLSYMLTARRLELVKKLILVGSGPFEHHYVEMIQKIRLNRLSEPERIEYNDIITLLNNPKGIGKAEKFARLGQLANKTDCFDPINEVSTALKSKDGEGNKFHEVLREAQAMRKSGRLLKLAENINCPVVALHGDYDPHPAEGVRAPLSSLLKDFRFITIEKCGHKPWIERQARDYFYELLRAEVHDI
jgi:pimeloyl-ACP methyl ester carboxylesterase